MTYNEQGLATKCVRSTWNLENGWVNDFMWEMEFDEQGRETYYLESYWNANTSVWEQYYETTISYFHEEGIVTGIASEKNWNSDTNQWETYGMRVFQHDENGNEISYIESHFQDSQWSVTLERTSTYDDNGRLFLAEEEYPSTGTKRYEYIYDDFGNKSALLISINGEPLMNYRWYYSAAQAIDAVFTTPDAWTRKMLRDGQLYIMRGDKTYTLTGKEVR